ncbi:4Fe-4S binding protein [Chloroflexota bacterium]
MARIFTAILISLVCLLLLATPAYACVITISPESATGFVDDILTFNISIQKTHRQCITPIEETVIQLKGVSLIEETPWHQVSSTVDEKQITVRLTEVGDGQIKVIRECSKGGDTYITKVTIEKAQDVPSNLVPSPLPTPPTIVPEPAPLPSPTPTLPTPELEPAPQPEDYEASWWDALKDGAIWPPIIATAVLIVFGIVALLKRYRRLRYLALLASISYLGFITGGCPCPLGALQNIIVNIGDVKELVPSYVLIGVPVLATILFGRVFCGWVCPWGAIQNFVYKKETGRQAKRFEVNARWHNILRYGKYVSLIALIIAVIVTQTKVYENVDPFKSLFNIQLVLVPTSILVVLMVFSLVIGFPWCKYVCPLGAFLALFSKLTLFKVRIGDKCTNCKACHDVLCDYKAIRPSDEKPDINQMECCRCGECISRCPFNAMDLAR